MSDESNNSSTPNFESSQTDSSQNQSQDQGQQADSSSDTAALVAQAATGTPAEKAVAKKMLKSMKLKVDGREFDEALPFEVEEGSAAEEYLRKNLQMSKMGQNRAQQYSNLEKEVKNFIEQLRKDPRKILSDPAIGLDVKDLARQIIEEEIENSKKSPEQLQREQLESELKAMKEERENEKKLAQEQEFERLKTQQIERYDILMEQALSKTDLPKSPYVVKKMADYMLIGLQNGKDITPEDVLPLVREEIMEDIKSMFNVMPDEVLEKFIGKDKINSMRKRNLSKARQNAATQAPTKTVDTAKAKEEPKDTAKKQNFKDFFGI